MVIERDKSNIENLLYVFILHKFPFDNRIILDFAKQKKTTKNLIVEYAISALQHLQSSEIRAFAIEKIKTSKNPIEYLEILISNYESGDCQLLSQIATQTNNEDDIKILAQIYSNIYNSNKTTECQQPLEILYNKMTCGIHRKVIVNILIDNKVLSEKIRSEIQFDSNIETRQIRI